MCVCVRVRARVCVCVLVGLVVSDSLRPCRLQPARLFCPWNSPGKNAGVGCHFLLHVYLGILKKERGEEKGRAAARKLTHWWSWMLIKVRALRWRQHDF